MESNFSLACYLAVLKNQNDFDGVTEQLKYAQLLQNPFEETGIPNLLELEIENSTNEKEKRGVTKKEENQGKNQ